MSAGPLIFAVSVLPYPQICFLCTNVPMYQCTTNVPISYLFKVKCERTIKGRKVIFTMAHGLFNLGQAAVFLQSLWLISLCRWYNKLHIFKVYILISFDIWMHLETIIIVKIMTVHHPPNCPLQFLFPTPSHSLLLPTPPPPKQPQICFLSP